MPSYNGNFRPSPFALVPSAIKILIGINVIVFIISALLPSTIAVDGIPLSAWFELHFALMPQGSEFFYPYWQLISYQFMHGGLSHIFFNMFALWMFGSELEQIWGTNRFLVYYLLCGIGGGVLHLAIGSDAPTVGASGAIMGVLVAFGMTFPDRPVMMFPIFIPIPAKVFVAIYALIDLVAGFGSSSDNIAHFAHLGGAIMGFLLIKFGDRFNIFSTADRLAQAMRSSDSSSQYGGRPVREARYRDIPAVPTTAQQGMFHGGSFFHKGEYVTEDTVNIILEKISATGYDSLDQREKDILLEISRRMS